MIEELGKNIGKTLLFTRPRRFGKTLNMSTVKNFFDIKYAQENKSLFDKLYISTSEYMSEQGKYPVIYLSFKDIKYLTWEKVQKKLKI